jgi:microcystin-dependent protein
MSEPFLAEIRIWSGTLCPRGWAFCQGQLLSIAQNQALFSLLGTTYGGNGVNNFALPNLIGRVPVHANQGPGLSNVVLGETGGSAQATLSTSQIPSHTHGVTEAGSAPNSGDPTGNLPATPGRRTPVYTSGSADTSMGATAASGSGLPIATRPPYLVINYIIALEGIFPSRP